MSLGMTCIPTLREEVVRLRQMDLLAQTEAQQLEALAREADERDPRRDCESAKGALRSSHRHWPARIAHTH